MSNTKNTINKIADQLFDAVAIVTSIFHLYILVTGGFEPLIQRPLHWGLISCLIFLKKPFRKNGPITWYGNLVPAVLTLIPCIYLAINQREMMAHLGSISQLEVVLGALCAVLVLEAGRRSMGPIFPMIALIFLLYAFLGPYVPGIMKHKGYSLRRIVKTLVYSSEGIFGVPINNSVKYIAPFILFGEVLSVCGVSRAFADVAGSITKKMIGGAAKAAVISSAMFGMISGGAVTNVMMSGTFTIPWMKKSGYRPEFAGAVEAVASSGGQIMPPIMGAAAFLIAEFLGITYPEVVKAAILPALLYFIVCFAQVDLYARNHREEFANETSWSDEGILTIIKREGILFFPLILMIYMFATGKSVFRSVLFAIIATPISRFIFERKFINLAEVKSVLVNGAKGMLSLAAACATAGILIAMLHLTGLSGIFSSLIYTLSGGRIFIALLITAVTCVVLGMGMPTTAAYIVLATLGAPALIRMGVAPIAAHFFIFFYACLAPITPPVALSSYAAAAIAEENPWKVSMEAVRIAFPIFLIPFMFSADPGLLLEGSIAVSAINFVTAIVGIVCFSAFAQGYLFGKLNMPIRLILFAAGALLMIPGTATDLAGAGFGIVVGGLLYMRSKKAGNKPSLEG